MSHFQFKSLLLFGIFALMPVSWAIASGSAPHVADASEISETLSEQWGIQIQTIRLVGGDHLLDLRYRVLDARKAASLLNRKNDAFLIHEKADEQLPVTVTKLGPMRQTSVKPKADRIYFILFSNLRKIAKSGDKITLVIGDMTARHLTIE